MGPWNTTYSLLGVRHTAPFLSGCFGGSTSWSSVGCSGFFVHCVAAQESGTEVKHEPVFGHDHVSVTVARAMTVFARTNLMNALKARVR